MNMIAEELANRLREVIINGLWIANTNYRKELSDLSFEDANTKIGSLNTIAALTQHIHYYISGILQVFNGGSLDIKDKYSFDFPEVTSQQSWEIIIEKLFDDTEKFALIVETIPESKLNEFFVDEKYGSYRRNIEAMIEHSYYHLGQIVLIKKLISNE
ncbi:DinB family protein [Flavobacterium sp. J372]|nr:DinB family protein [Flavobacterium sp. J372]